MTNVYKGRIRSIDCFAGSSEGNEFMLGFVSREEDTKGLSITIGYQFKSHHQYLVFKSDLERRLNSEPKGVEAEVCLTKPLDRMVSEYEGIGPIRFLEDEPPRAA